MLNSALALAVRQSREEIAEVLLEHRASVHSISLAEVLATSKPKLFRRFLERGADPVEGYPFTDAFLSHVHPAFRVCKELLGERPDLSDCLQDQLDRALRHFCAKGELRMVAMALWAGGNPRSIGPEGLDVFEAEDVYGSALSSAIYNGHLSALKLLKPRAGIDDLTVLLAEVTVASGVDLINYLVTLGARPNDSSGSSSALDRCISGMTNELYNLRRYGPATPHALSKAIKVIGCLARHGAIWQPDARSIEFARRALRECSAEATLEFLTILVEHRACSAETLSLLLSPKLKAHISTASWRVERLRLANLVNLPGRGTRRKKLADSSIVVTTFDRNALYVQVAGMPTKEVAALHGISERALYRVCEELGVPLPRRCRPTLAQVSSYGTKGQENT